MPISPDVIKVETVPVKVVAKMLGIAPMKVKAAIKNGTMPVGLVAKEEGKSLERTVVIKTRLERWLDGEL